MPSSESISHWIQLLKSGHHEAVQPLWEAYFHRLVGLAAARLRGRVSTMADGEDAALSAFATFCRRVVEGRFPQLNDRDDLWRLLVVITVRKASALLKREGQDKAGGSRVLNGTALSGSRAADDEEFIAQITDPNPTPEFAAMVAEEHARRINLLRDPVLRAVAQLKLDGHSNEEIAERLRCGLRTVERRLWLIRQLWRDELTE